MNIVQQLTKELHAQTKHSQQLEEVATAAMAMLNQSISPYIDHGETDQWHKDIAALNARFAHVVAGDEDK